MPGGYVGTSLVFACPAGSTSNCNNPAPVDSNRSLRGSARPWHGFPWNQARGFTSFRQAGGAVMSLPPILASCHAVWRGSHVLRHTLKDACLSRASNTTAPGLATTTQSAVRAEGGGMLAVHRGGLLRRPRSSCGRM